MSKTLLKFVLSLVIWALSTIFADLSLWFHLPQIISVGFMCWYLADIQILLQSRKSYTEKMLYYLYENDLLDLSDEKIEALNKQ